MMREAYKVIAPRDGKSSMFEKDRVLRNRRQEPRVYNWSIVVERVQH